MICDICFSAFWFSKQFLSDRFSNVVRIFRRLPSVLKHTDAQELRRSQLDHCSERVASIRRSELMGRRAVKRVFHAVDVRAARAKAWRGPPGRLERVAAHDYVRALEDTASIITVLARGSFLQQAFHTRLRCPLCAS